MVEVNIPDKAAAAAPSVVLTAASDDTSPAPLLAMARELPGLKPYHPNHSANVPNLIKNEYCMSDVKIR